ncbi:MAG: hypothetical protein IJ763_07235 [Lachnospiraceae bacterium]|nr:hypothetical protein [Lachnospiraceae bacterium]
MRALFIGGTGTISTAVVKRLVEELDWEVWLINRGSRKVIESDRLHSIIADINNEEDVAKKLEGLSFDTVCEFIGFTVKDIINRQQILLLLRVRPLLIHIGSIPEIRLPVKNFL